MFNIYHKTDEEYVADLKKKYINRKPYKLLYNLISHIFSQIVLIFFLFIQFYSAKNILFDMQLYESNNVFFTSFGFIISILTLIFANIVHVSFFIREIFGNKTEILLLKYYDLSIKKE